MSTAWWPWTSEEESEWEREAQQEQAEGVEELLDQMASGLAGSSYDPLQPQDDWVDEEVSIT
jgi:hypothetical protein